MNRRVCSWAVGVFVALLLTACASRPITQPLKTYDPAYGYRIGNLQLLRGDPTFGLVIAMSGGGTRAAALSYGVLEELRRTSVPGPQGPHPLLNEVKVITGVSGGSFTALAYALHGDRLFDEFESRFLKRNVQGHLLSQVLNPVNWTKICCSSYSRTELAADFYDEILFQGATYADLMAKRDAPLVSVSATEISTGARFTFNQNTFDVICADLASVRLARAAASSSAVPVVFEPITLDNYAGTCGSDLDKRVREMIGTGVSRSVFDRAERRRAELAALTDATKFRYLHVVDGGVADNLGLRTLLEGLEIAIASQRFREITGFDGMNRFAVIVVNSLSNPETDWGSRESAPGILSQLLKSGGISIDRYSYDQISLLHDNVRILQERGTHPIDFFQIEVGFAGIHDPHERRYFMDLPTSFSLSGEQVDKLREIGGRLLRESPEFQRLLKSLSAVPSGVAQ
ncbi:patatin-like phospholipase family protein [Ramlibacter tataouinensis]|uniref:PNPLA domain-containing protein n=1 Tax=Ramlibacter tataouinensis TaxID=94132 RepID=A0A127JVL7_9BURK|nr:patatin-like phospholipase family protein [Ramlibacter tataouinensis]AMO24048.1 hypothetical protein UC35_15795 [Ramlibacter tataouinensis]